MIAFLDQLNVKVMRRKVFAHQVRAVLTVLALAVVQQGEALVPGPGCLSVPPSPLPRPHTMLNASRGAQRISAAKILAPVAMRRDLNDDLTTLTYPGGATITCGYDAEDRLVRMTNNLVDDGVFSFSYDSGGRLTGITYPNGVVSTNIWDLSDRLREFRHSKSGALVLRRLAYDDADRPIREEIDAGAIPKPTGESWREETCDLADRVTSAFGMESGAPATWSYGYDGAGNLLDASRTMAGEVTMASYAYDLAGRMVAITNGAAIESYTYDAGGSRVKRVKDAATRYYALDYADGFKRPLAEIDSAGTIVRRYVWAGPLLLAVVESNGLVRYAHSDGQGSVLALTDGNGTVTDQFAYGPYGEPWARTGTNELPFRWLGGSGVVHAGDGLYLTYHRLYDSSLKRFLQSDPKGIAGGLNLYAYGNLSPLVYVDPLGLEAHSGIPSFTSSFGSQQFQMAATGWYGGTGIRLNTAQRVIAGVWGLVQAAADILALTPMLGAGSMNAGNVATRGSTLTATERVYMTGAYSATRAPVGKPMPLVEQFAGSAGRRLTQTLAGRGAPSIQQGQHIVDTAVTEFLPRLKLRAPPRYNPALDLPARARVLSDGTRVTEIGPRSINNGYPETVDSLIHEDLHHRWWGRGIPSPHDHDRLQEVIERYSRRRGWR